MKNKKPIMLSDVIKILIKSCNFLNETPIQTIKRKLKK